MLDLKGCLNDPRGWNNLQTTSFFVLHIFLLGKEGMLVYVFFNPIIQMYLKKAARDPSHTLHYHS